MTKKKNLHDFYEIIPDPTKTEEDQWCIQLKKGFFADAVFRFGRVKLVRENGAKDAKGVVYEYDLVYLPTKIQNKKLSKRENQKLHALLGDIILEILQEGFLETDRMKHGDDTFTQEL